MIHERHALGPYRETAMLKKWNERPQEGEPDEVIERTWYYEADHTPVTDPQRIAEIEAFINANTDQDTDAMQVQAETIHKVRAGDSARLSTDEGTP